MANQVYDNYFLSNEISDQMESKLDLSPFFQVDRSLVGTPGMLRKVNRYKATNGTEELAMGEGNTKSIEVSYTTKEYRIKLAQNNFKYYDEQAMTDPVSILTGARHTGVDMYNKINADVYGELEGATMVVLANNFDFDAFVDAQAMLHVENLEDINTFAFVHPTDYAELRKKLKDSLQYVRAFATEGYVGTVGATNVYVKKDANKGEIYLATKEAVTAFEKLGVEVVQSPRSAEDENIRLNTVFCRKYYIVALTDETKVVKITKGTAALSVDTEVNDSKTYYELVGTGYVAVEPEDGDNPVTEGWYEITAA